MSTLMFAYTQPQPPPPQAPAEYTNSMHQPTFRQIVQEELQARYEHLRDTCPYCGRQHGQPPVVIEMTFGELYGEYKAISHKDRCVECVADEMLRLMKNGYHVETI
jgi:hypothetical protein